MGRLNDLDRIRAARCRPLVLADVADIGAAYMQYWIGPEFAELLVDGQVDEFNTRTCDGSFVARFSDYEEPELQRLLRTTADLSRLPLERRFARETVAGVTLRDRDTNDLLAAVIFTVPPQRVEADPQYRLTLANFFQSGATGGGMEYSRAAMRADLETTAAAGRIAVLWLILKGRGVRHGATYAMFRALEAVLKVRPDVTTVRAYFLAHLDVAIDGRRVEFPPPLGRNSACMALAVERLGMTEFAIERTYPAWPGAPGRPAARHIVRGKTVELFPTWAHIQGDARGVLERSRVASSALIDAAE